MTVSVEFAGGLETLFHGKKSLSIEKSLFNPRAGGSLNVTGLIRYLGEEVVQQEKKELFILDATVRPGILVLINDSDWELEGEGSYELKDGDNIVFVSTLHGG